MKITWSTLVAPLPLVAMLLLAPLPAQSQKNAPGAADPALPPQFLLRSLEQRLGANPFDAVSLNNLAVIRMAEGDPMAAAELLARAHRLAPDNSLITDNHERLNRWLGERAEAGKTDAMAAVAELPADAPFPPEPPPLWPRP